MRNKSIWTRRILKLAELNFKSENVEGLIELIKETFVEGEERTPNYLFSSYNLIDNTRNWYNTEYLKLFIELMIDLEIFYRKESNLKPINKNEKLAESVKKRGTISVKTQTQTAIERLLKKKIDTIIYHFKNNIKSFATIEYLTISLGKYLSKDKLKKLEALFKIYADIDPELTWTAKTTYGSPLSNIEIKLSQDEKKDYEKILNPIIKDSNDFQEVKKKIGIEIENSVLPKLIKKELIEIANSLWAIKIEEKKKEEEKKQIIIEEVEKIIDK